MSAKHTQDGPWEDAGLTGNDPRITGGPLRLIKCAGVVIAFLPAWLNDEHEEARANARLIKAAPNMLAALQAIAPFIPSTSKADGGAAKYSANVVAADMVRAAVAEATGGQS